MAREAEKVAVEENLAELRRLALLLTGDADALAADAALTTIGG